MAVQSCPTPGPKGMLRSAQPPPGTSARLKAAGIRVLTRLNVVHGVDTLPAETCDAGAIRLASLALVPAALAGLGDGDAALARKCRLGLADPAAKDLGVGAAAVAIWGRAGLGRRARGEGARSVRLADLGRGARGDADGGAGRKSVCLGLSGGAGVARRTVEEVAGVVDEAGVASAPAAARSEVVDRVGEEGGGDIAGAAKVQVAEGVVVACVPVDLVVSRVQCRVLICYLQLS
jgi:hypothetical protein